jgi:hypothetical protein
MGEFHLRIEAVPQRELVDRVAAGTYGSLEHGLKLEEFGLEGTAARLIQNEVASAMGAAAFRLASQPSGSHDGLLKRMWTELAQTLSSLLMGRYVKTGASVPIQEKVPICVFDSPRTPRSEVAFEASEASSLNVSWSVTVPGAGFGANGKLTVTVAQGFKSSKGERKIVFVPLDLLLTTYEDRFDSSRKILSVEINPDAPSSFEGIRTVTDDEEWRRLCDPLEPAKLAPFSEDKSGEIATVTLANQAEVAFFHELGLKYQGIGAKTKVKIESKVKTQFKCKLPVGRDYRIARPRDRSGLLFEPLV